MRSKAPMASASVRARCAGVRALLYARRVLGREPGAALDNEQLPVRHTTMIAMRPHGPSQAPSDSRNLLARGGAGVASGAGRCCGTRSVGVPVSMRRGKSGDGRRTMSALVFSCCAAGLSVYPTGAVLWPIRALIVGCAPAIALKLRHRITVMSTPNSLISSNCEHADRRRAASAPGECSAARRF